MLKRFKFQNFAKEMLVTKHLTLNIYSGTTCNHKRMCLRFKLPNDVEEMLVTNKCHTKYSLKSVSILQFNPFCK